MEQMYRIEDVEDAPFVSHYDFSLPKSIFTLIRMKDGETLRVRLPRRGDWRKGDVVRISDTLILSNLEGKGA